jgi:alkanesulfonate monooxygenase
MTLGLHLYSTCPHRLETDGGPTYAAAVAHAARWSEEAGYEGMLIYAANEAPADPWLLAQIVVQATRGLSPLVSVNPPYMHPFTAAKLVASIASLYGRRTDLNVIAGGFANDLAAFADVMDHDGRYRRLTEYVAILEALLRDERPVSFAGEFYRTDRMKLAAPPPAELRPRLFVSGSSAASLDFARLVGAISLHYPTFAEDDGPEAGASDLRSGVRLGIVTRPDGEAAWRVARVRFPDDRRGQVRHMLAMSVSDSVWHKRLSALGDRAEAAPNPFWLGPFQNDQDYAPYLVGDYDTVAKALALLIRAGRRWFIVDAPPDADEAQHVRAAFARAETFAGAS